MKNTLTFLCKSILTVLMVYTVSAIQAQITLDTFIGTQEKPSDDDTICSFLPDITHSMSSPLEGTLVHDFKLYTVEGEYVQLSEVMQDKKPVLLIGCSYTCYVYRRKADKIFSLQEQYGDKINMFLVYTLEAHPVTDISPYFGVENIGEPNHEKKIYYRQPLTYGDRKRMAGIMQDSMKHEISVPVLIDDPCNSWWQNYGTNPNCAFLIDPNGYVYDAQNWFNRKPDDMFSSVKAILDTMSRGAYKPVPKGTFASACAEKNNTIHGGTGDTLSAHFTITNTSSEDVLIDFRKEDIKVPAGWLTYFYTDICHAPDQHATTLYLLPGSSETIRVDFFTGGTPASGSLNVVLQNRNDAANAYTYNIVAVSKNDSN